jgi:hypothetical protein
MEQLTPKLVGEKHVPSFIRMLNNEFMNHKIYFESNRYSSDYFKNDCVIVSGAYSPKILFNSESVVITLSFPNDQRKVRISNRGAENLQHRIIRTFYHEYKHKLQFKNKSNPFRQKRYYPKNIRNEKLCSNLSYLGSSDEIDAHAYETIMDLKRNRLSINMLREASKITMKQSEAIWLYNKYFRKYDSKIWQKFLKKVYKHGRSIC